MAWRIIPMLSWTTRCDMAKAVGDAFRCSKLILAATTYNAGIFPFMREFIAHLTVSIVANSPNP